MADHKTCGTPIPHIGPEPITFNSANFGFTLAFSEECLREIAEIELNQRLAFARAQIFYFD